MPIIDRDFLPDRHGKERKRSSRVLILAVILVTVLVLGATAGLMIQIVNNREPHPSETPVRTPVRILYTTHSPISIVGNAGFTNASGVVWGSGTASDPYTIADWDITPSTADGIWIQDTDAHFIVRNCYVHDASPGYWGIVLWNCVNGTLKNNSCSNNPFCMYLESSSNNTLINNTCLNNPPSSFCIYLGYSSNNTLTNNTCGSNGYFGIYLFISNNNTLTNNTCGSNNGYGIHITNSNGNTLSNNTCCWNYYDGIYLLYSSNNTLTNNTCDSNYHDGIYLDSSSNNTLGNNTLTNNICCSNKQYGICLSYSSSNNTLSNNTCSSNGYDGICLSSSSNNTLINNTCSSNYHDGIGLALSSDNNEVSRDLVCNNAGYGVYISSGSNNRIWNNTIIGNNGATDTYNASHVQARNDGTYNWWNSTDGYGNWWNDWQSPDNVPPYGIVDLPYNISGSAGAKDNYPLTTPPAPKPEYCTGSVITTGEFGDPESTFIQGQSVYVNVLAMYQGSLSDLEVTVSLVDLNGSALDSFTVHTNDPVVGWYNSSVSAGHLTLWTGMPISDDEQAFDVVVEISGSGYEIARTAIVIKKQGLRFDPVQNNPAYWPGQLINVTLVAPMALTSMFYVHVVNETGGSAGINWTHQVATDGTWGKQFVIPDTWSTGDYVMKVRDQTTSAIWYSLLFHVINSPPIAEAGPNQTMTVGDTVVFNGSGSFDDGGVVNWTWTFSYDDDMVELNESQPTFRFEREGVYEVTLVVRDGAGNTASDTMNVTVETAIPEMSNAGMVVAVVALCAIMLVVARNKRDLGGI